MVSHGMVCLRQITEKYKQVQRPLYSSYAISTIKKHDTVWQEGLWAAMQHLGYPSKIVNLLQSLYKISKSAVRVNNDLTNWFQTLTGTRQGCILSPQLFNILLELVITTAIEDSYTGLRLNGSIVNNLRLADDIALMAESETDLQTLVDLVHTTSKQFGLTINIGKTEVQVINSEPKPVSISIQGKTLN